MRTYQNTNKEQIGGTMDYEFISLVVLAIGFAVLWINAEMRVADIIDELFDVKRGGYGRTL